MSELRLMEPLELTEAELDAIAAGQLTQGAFGLVSANIGATIGNVTVNALNGNTVTLTDVLSHNTVQVPIGVAVAALSGAAGVLKHI